MNKFMKLSVVTLPLVVASAAHAEVRINGFANFVAGTVSSGDEFSNLAGDVAYDDSLSFAQDSLFAIQVSADVNEKMTATAQIIARGNDEYSPSFEWAYLSYSASDNLSVSVGRLRAPFFRYSDSADVGYSYHWISAPEAVYSVGFNNLNGFRVDYTNYIGDWDYNLQVAGGTYTDDVASGTLSGEDTLVFTAEATYDWFKIRAVYGQATASYNNEFFDMEFDTIESGGTLQIGIPVAASPELADALRVSDDKGVFLGLGLEVDKFDWFISGEITEVDQTDAFAGVDLAYYVTGGLRLGKFTPSLTYEALDGTRDGIRFQNIVASLPEEAQFTLGLANGVLQGLAFDEYSKITATLRYDWNTNTALKADIAKYTDDNDETGASDYTLVRLGVHYIF